MWVGFLELVLVTFLKVPFLCIPLYFPKMGCCVMWAKDLKNGEFGMAERPLKEVCFPSSACGSQMHRLDLSNKYGARNVRTGQLLRACPHRCVKGDLKSSVTLSRPLLSATVLNC